MKTLVYVGPSLSSASHASRGGVTFGAPIRRGDLCRATAEGYRCIGIIDGEFGQSLAVSISEIRQALKEGVAVYGAASMGALRAAECRSIGMRGVGYIYERYARGDLTADDEVALVFDRDSHRALTVPLVNLRWTLEIALANDWLTDHEERAIWEVAQAMPYDQRCYGSLVAALRNTKFERAARMLQRLVASDPVRFDRKRLDALELLATEPFRSVVGAQETAGAQG